MHSLTHRTSQCFYLSCSWRNALWLNTMHCGKKWWIREFVAPYIFPLNPDYVAARSIRSLRSNYRNTAWKKAQYRNTVNPRPPPSDHFYIILASITRTMFWALKKWGIKSSVLAPETQISVNFPYYLSQCCRLMLFVTKRETAFLLKKVKHMLYLGYVLLP